MPSMGSRQQGRSFQGELAPTTLLTPEASGGGGQAGELVPPMLTSPALAPQQACLE